MKRGPHRCAAKQVDDRAGWSGWETARFCGKAMLAWVHERGMKLHLIEPGTPNLNARIESFNSLRCDECLNGHWFAHMMQACALIEKWKRECKGERSKTSLCGLASSACFERLSD